MRRMITDMRLIKSFWDPSDDLYVYSIGSADGTAPEVSSFISLSSLLHLIAKHGLTKPEDLVGFQFTCKPNRNAIEDFISALKEAYSGPGRFKVDERSLALEQTITCLSDLVVPDFRPTNYEQTAEKLFADMYPNIGFAPELCICVQQRRPELTISLSVPQARGWLMKFEEPAGETLYVYYRHLRREPFEAVDGNQDDVFLIPLSAILRMEKAV